MLIYLLFLIQLIPSRISTKFCCDHEFKIEKEYCEPLASVFEFQVLNLKEKTTDRIEYNVEVVKTYRGHFQIHTSSVLFAIRHYCVPELRLNPGQIYLAITKSFRVTAFTIDICFFDQIQFAYPKVRNRHLVCLPYNSSFKNQSFSFFWLILIFILHKFLVGSF